MFNDQKEYRAIATRSVRYSDGFIEHVADFGFDETDRVNESGHLFGDVYKEECVLEKGNGKVIVLNHISFDENGMLLIDDYRLMMGGK